MEADGFAIEHIHLHNHLLLKMRLCLLLDNYIEYKIIMYWTTSTVTSLRRGEIPKHTHL